MDMVALDQNMLYIILAVLVILIILVIVFVRRRRSKDGPSNINKLLQNEAELKKKQIAESEAGFKLKTPLYMRRPQDELNDIREVTSQLEHQKIYHNRKVEEKLEKLETTQKNVNLQRQHQKISKKHQELSENI